MVQLTLNTSFQREWKINIESISINLAFQYNIYM